jgi:hypothetical protein
LLILDHTTWVQLSLLESKPIENVSSERWDFLAIDLLRRTGPRLGILASHSTDADNPLVRSPDQHQAHLQEKLDLGFNGALLTIVEQLRAVSALEEKRLALSHIPEMFPETDNLSGMNDWRKTLEFRN